MDDLSALVSQILSDPGSVEQLQAMAQSLGLTSNSQENASGDQQAQFTSQPEQSPQSTLPVPVQQRQPSSVPNVDLGALSQILAGLTGKSTPAPQPQQNTPDLSALTGLLGGNNQGQQNQGGGVDLSALAGLLGGGQQQAQASNTSGGGGLDLSALSGILGNAQSNSQESSGGLDLSALSGLLGGGNGSASSGSGPDLSALSGLLGGLTGNSGGNAQSTDTNSSVSALANMLGAGQTPATAPGPAIDMSTIMKISQAMSTLSTGQENVRMLLALKSHLRTEERAKKVDDAIKVMQLIQFLPLLKESGLFGGIDDLLGKFNLGGIGNILSPASGGIGSLLSPVTGGLGSLLGGTNSRGGR